MPSTPEKQFSQELEYLRREIDSGTQMLFAHLAFQEIAGTNSKVLQGVNETPLFWGTTLYAWQCGYFITLHRIFDSKNRYHVSRVLELARENTDIFSKTSLANRKRHSSDNADEWLPEYLAKVYVPSAKDIRELERKLSFHKSRYDARYRRLRNKIFAHRDVADPEKVRDLFSQTSVREMKGMYLFLAKLYDALWELLHNGRKPKLRPLRHSVGKLVKSQIESWGTQKAHEIIIAETRDVLSIVGARRASQSS